MTPEELRRASAVEVMGWNAKPSKGTGQSWHSIDGGHKFQCFVADWSPDARWDHAGMLVDRMRELGFVVEMQSDHRISGVTMRKDLLICHRASEVPQLAITTAAVEAMRKWRGK